jgi:hypothetical protein
MAWFREGKRLEYDHPIFGRLVRDHLGDWVGEITFPPAGHAIQLRQPGPESGPGDWGGQVYAELLDRFPMLRELIVVAIFDHYTSQHWEGAPTPLHSDELGEILTLDDVRLEGPGQLSLGYGFVRDAGWDDAVFSVHLRDWRVSGIQLED